VLASRLADGKEYEHNEEDNIRIVGKREGGGGFEIIPRPPMPVHAGFHDIWAIVRHFGESEGSDLLPNEQCSIFPLSPPFSGSAVLKAKVW
jgi:hypothetical protein